MGAAAAPLAIGAGVGAAGGLLGRDSAKTLTQSGGGSGQSQSTYAPHQQLLPGYGFLGGNALGMMQQPVPYFPGQGYIGPSLATQAGVNASMNAAQGAMPQYLQQQQRNYNFLSNAADVNNNPVVQGMLDVNRRAVNQNFRENLLPAINSSAQQVNALGSGRQGIAQAQGAERTAEQLARANQQLLSNAYNTGIGAQQNALGQTGNVLGNLLAPSTAMLGAGQVAEQYQQRALDDAMRRFAYQYQEPYQRMSNLAGTLGFLQPLGTQYGSQASSQSGTAPNPNYQSAGQALFGGAATGAGLAGQFFT